MSPSLSPPNTKNANPKPVNPETKQDHLPLPLSSPFKIGHSSHSPRSSPSPRPFFFNVPIPITTPPFPTSRPSSAATPGEECTTSTRPPPPPFALTPFLRASTLSRTTRGTNKFHMYWRNVRVVPKTKKTKRTAVTPGANSAKSVCARDTLRSGSAVRLAGLFLAAARSWKVMTTIWKRLARREWRLVIEVFMRRKKGQEGVY